MIVITGAAGFIGSVILGYLNKQRIDNIILVDNFKNSDQYKNLVNKNFRSIHYAAEELENMQVEAVIHFGANSSTLEKNWESIYETNIKSTRYWAEFTKKKKAKLIFASSAAVYGNGQGPLNLYGFSKLASEYELKDAVILRLFNVYGPNEYHKGRMASTIFHWYHQLKEKDELSIFENSEKYLRDFIYVEDVARIVEHFLENFSPGTYDVGSGTSTSFETLADQLLSIKNSGSKNIIEMPNDLKSQYQTGTIANLSNLKQSGFDINSIKTTVNGLNLYQQYLLSHSYY